MIYKNQRNKYVNGTARQPPNHRRRDEQDDLIQRESKNFCTFLWYPSVNVLILLQTVTEFKD